jgi:uncharacterized protein (TIGR03792 family)
MVIEWLRFTVSPELREQFVQKDDEIWTCALATYPGFLGKEVWISPDTLSNVVMVIRWASFADWDAIPPNDLQQINAAFNQVMGDTFTLEESLRYQVRKMRWAQEDQ